LHHHTSRRSIGFSPIALLEVSQFHSRLKFFARVFHSTRIVTSC
jgi:hypothetical protein